VFADPSLFTVHLLLGRLNTLSKVRQQYQNWRSARELGQMKREEEKRGAENPHLDEDRVIDY